jgi:V/A-type H+-transporting ATPase subunit I
MSIAKMSRIFLVGPVLYKEEALRFLQRAGVVHPEPMQPLAGQSEKQTSAALLRVRRLGQVEQALRRYRSPQITEPADGPYEDLLDRAEAALTALQEAGNSRKTFEQLADELAPWGDFDPEALRRLEDEGVYVRCWRPDRGNNIKLVLPDDVFAKRISEKKDAPFFTVSLEEAFDIPGATLIAPQEMGLSQAQKEIEQLQARQADLTEELSRLALRTESFKKLLAQALNEARYLEQMGTLYSHEDLFGLQGWIPEDAVGDFSRRISDENLPLLCELREPLEEEEPPVLLKNNWFVRRIEPLLKLYGIPRYGMRDPSYFFAPFMVLFFGMCLGDAGYGLVFYLVAHFIGKKLGDEVEGLPLIVKLCKAFAVSCALFGLLTGSVFGFSLEQRRWILLDVSVGAGNPMILFYISLGLGFVHLSISYILGLLAAADLYTRMQKLGQLFVLSGGVALVVMNIWFSSPDVAIYGPLFYGGSAALALGVLLTLVFATDHRNVFIRFGVGLWNVYGLTGLIGDFLSYARLFGLGVGTAAIASVMNQLAGMVLGATGPVIGTPLALIVIILGHSFNLALGILSGTIHSARLHFVEAFKNFFAGGGIEYKPFKVEGEKP